MLLILAVAVTVNSILMVTMPVQLLGAVRALKIVTLTGGGEESDGDKQHAKSFHCGVL